VAYKLLLPESANIHLVFHVSQLKRHVESHAVPNPNLPLVDSDGKIKTEPVAILERRLVARNHEPVVQWLIQWLNLASEDATWEDADFIRKVFPGFHPSRTRMYSTRGGRVLWGVVLSSLYKRRLLH